ncbi:hypothetical protein ACFLX2_01410 [Candidatus Dependentiae bacterium]
MKKTVVLSFFFIISSIITAANQDIIVNGMVIAKGTDDCNKNYQAIKTAVLEKYQRPITILEIGAESGFYSFSIATDYRCATCVMIEQSDQLLRLCKANNTLNNIILLKEKPTIKSLELLSECQHFDVVLALDVLRIFPNDWSRAISIMLTLGDNILFQATQSDHPQNEQVQQSLKTITGTAVENTNIFLFPMHKLYLHKAFWQAPEALPLGDYFIEATETKKLFHSFVTERSVDWPCGIGLLTFLNMSGTFPSNKTMIKNLRKLNGINHHNLTTASLIVQGDGILPTDFYDEQEVPRHIAQQHLQECTNLFP